jgi:GDPmannose 4,6-dehydratase
VPTALITGITGQTGSYLAEYLGSEGWDVVGIFRSEDDETGAFRTLMPSARLIQGDLGDFGGLSRLVHAVAPDTIFNLGGLSSVAQSWEEPVPVALINGVSAAALLDAALSLMRSSNRPVSFVQASSAEIFGFPEESPQSESTPINPTNPYGASKAYAHHLVGVYRRLGLAASSCILYNHESPRRSINFVTRKITSGVAAIATGSASSLVLGNLEARRDWGWAPDYARAIALAAAMPDDYVIATGISHSVRDFVAAAFAAVGIEDWEPSVYEDSQFLRPTDAPDLVGDPSHARLALGWKPEVGFEELVSRMVANDLQLLRGSTT